MVECQNDASWVLDSLVGFLKGPVWNLSILNFIEQKSVIFEPEEDTYDALELEYSKIFNEFKQMVDTLLASHMEDLEISPSQFENACLSAKENLGSKLHAILFEQIWAATNYRIFKRMMIQRNIDLQLQALELLGQKSQVTKDTLCASSLSPSSQICEEEFELMQDLFKKNLGTNEISSVIDVNQETIENVLLDNKENKKLDAEEKVNFDNQLLKDSDEKKEEINDSDKKMSNFKTKVKKLIKQQSQIIDQVLNNQGQLNEKETTINTNDLNAKKFDLLMGTSNAQVNKEDLEKRQNYLRIQRDKLIELKRKERSKQIVKVGETEMKASRPKSAKAIKASLKPKMESEDDEKKQNQDEKSNENGLAYRKMLAARLKAELIGGSINETIDTPNETK